MWREEFAGRQDGTGALDLEILSVQTSEGGDWHGGGRHGGGRDGDRLMNKKGA